MLEGVISLAYPTVGALIASRLPGNLIGWILCAMGLHLAAQHITVAYADYALQENFALPGGEYMARFATWAGLPGHVLGFYAIVFGITLFLSCFFIPSEYATS